jgi:predicted DNA-binding transcriptional regulator AlpA
MQQNINKTIQLLRLPQVLERFPVCKSKWWAGVKRGVYPKPIRHGSRCTMWRAEDIDQLIDEVSKSVG